MSIGWLFDIQFALQYCNMPVEGDDDFLLSMEVARGV